MSRQLEAKRAELKEEQRRNRRPPVTSVKEQDVVVALTQLREVLLSDVGRAAPVLQALVGDVVIESRKVEGQKRPEMVAKFTIDGIPALAALDRGKAAGSMAVAANVASPASRSNRSIGKSLRGSIVEERQGRGSTG